MAGPAVLIRADRKFPFVEPDTAFRSIAPAGPRIMSDPVHQSPMAVAPLRAVRTTIAQFNPQAAEAVAIHLLAAGNSLDHVPNRGPPAPGTSMRALVANDRYAIRYRVTRDGTVRILRVRHCSRRPTNF